MFNALDLMENKQFLEKLKFGIGDGNLQYYLYNWKCPQMKVEQVSQGAEVTTHFIRHKFRESQEFVVSPLSLVKIYYFAFS